MPEQITQKRRNPFETPINQTPRQEPPKVVVEEVVEEEPVEEVVVVQRPQPKKQERKPVYVAPVDSGDREKYTATMETNLRREIKIFCATRGIMFSEFIEQACLEKLQRDGKR